MKKFFYLLMLAVAGVAFTACEDVPAPYIVNTSTSGNTNSDVLLNESFATSLGKFTNQTTSGDGAWIIDFKTAKASGYDNSSKVTTAGTYYLVSPELDLTDVEAAHISFEYILRYLKNKQDQRVLISTDYAGDAKTATWAELPVTLVEGSDWDTFAKADVNIPAEFIGKKIVIAFYYNCGSSNSSTWEVKNLMVQKGRAEGGDTDTPENPGETKTLPYEESFETSLGSFINQTTSGSGAWIIDFKTAKATGYDGNSKTTTAGTYFLISPAIDLSNVSNAHVAYEYILRYNKGDENQQALISSDYIDDANKATWTVLKKKHNEGSDWNTFSNEDITVPTAFLGKVVRIAFVYNTNASSGSTWEVKNFSIKEGEGSETPDGSLYGDGNTPDPQSNETKTLPYEESFETSFGSFINQTTSGSGAWIIDFKTAKATGYDGSSKTTTAGTYFLISPAIELSNVSNAHVAYEYILRYNKGDENQQALISSDYIDDANKATWTVLKKKHNEGSDWNTFSNEDITVPTAFLGKVVRIAFVYNTNASSGSTWEVKNFSIKEGSGNEAADGSAYGNSETPTPTPGEGTGTGTLTDPYNAVAATNVATSLGAGNTSSESYYIKGKVSDIKFTFDAEHGTATFFISDDGSTTNQFQVYSTYYLGNRSWTTGDTQIQLGDEVIIYGQLTNYNGTPETASKKSYIYSLNGVTDGGNPSPTPDPGTGTSLDDFTNGDFETWADGIPTGWDSGASFTDYLSQSSTVHGGNYSCKITHYVKSDAKQNTRLAYRSLDLEAGTYTISAWVRAESSSAVARLGHYNGAAYSYGSSSDFFRGITTEWQQISKTFELSAGSYSFIIMNSKESEDALLVDDVTIVKN